MQKLTKLEQKIVAVTQVNELSADPKSPFTPEIDQIRADLTKKMPPIETYDNTGDPYDHTHIYMIVSCATMITLMLLDARCLLLY